MSEAPSLLFPAVSVFVLLVVGLGLTWREFSQMSDHPEDRDP